MQKGRGKVPLKPGHTLADWARLIASGANLAGRKGELLRVPLSEVKKHTSADDAWIVFNGKVYNITRYLDFHPGGALCSCCLMLCPPLLS
jgi:cytochrome b involved in lipid metabolism